MRQRTQDGDSKMISKCNPADTHPLDWVIWIGSEARYSLFQCTININQISIENISNKISYGVGTSASKKQAKQQKSLQVEVVRPTAEF